MRIIPLFLFALFALACSAQMPALPPTNAPEVFAVAKLPDLDPQPMGDPTNRTFSWTASLSSNVAYYELQQNTSILSHTFFDVTNVAGTSTRCTIPQTNQSGTVRIRAVNSFGVGSTWTYWSL